MAEYRPGGIISEIVRDLLKWAVEVEAADAEIERLKELEGE